MHEKKKKTNSKHKKKKPVKEPPKQEPKIEEKKEEPIEDADKTASSSECSEDSGDEFDNERKYDSSPHISIVKSSNFKKGSYFENSLELALTSHGDGVGFSYKHKNSVIR